MTGLSVGFAFKTGLFNIGAPGQLMVGGFVSVWVGCTWTVPAKRTALGGRHPGGHGRGGPLGLVPGVFKALFKRQ